MIRTLCAPLSQQRCFRWKRRTLDQKILTSAILFGLGACQAWEKSKSFDFGGDAMYEAMLNSSFEGASGKVALDPVTGTRDPMTAYFVMKNYVRKQINATHIVFEERETDVVLDREWVAEIPFVYNDGSTNMPPPLPPFETDYKYIGKSVRISGLFMAAFIILLSVICGTWSIWLRKTYVVRASQPIFLLILCVGTLIMGASIIPLSIDDEISSNNGCRIACMAVPWLFSTGFATIFAALYSKLNRVNRLFNSPSFKRVKVTTYDVMKPLIGLLLANFVVLISWTIFSPMRWTRETDAWDSFGRPISSRGYCTSDRPHVFLWILILVDLGALLLSSYQSYLARNIATEFAESEYVAKSVACMVLVSFVGVPTLLLVQGEPRARYFVIASITFVLCFAVLLFIFVPKAGFARKNPKPSTFFQAVHQSSIQQGRKSSYAPQSLQYSVGSIGSIRSTRSTESSSRSAERGFQPEVPMIPESNGSTEESEEGEGIKVVDFRKSYEKMRLENQRIRGDYERMCAENHSLRREKRHLHLDKEILEEKVLELEKGMFSEEENAGSKEEELVSLLEEEKDEKEDLVMKED